MISCPWINVSSYLRFLSCRTPFQDLTVDTNWHYRAKLAQMRQRCSYHYLGTFQSLPQLLYIPLQLPHLHPLSPKSWWHRFSHQNPFAPLRPLFQYVYPLDPHHLTFCLQNHHQQKAPDFSEFLKHLTPPVDHVLSYFGPSNSSIFLPNFED